MSKKHQGVKVKFDPFKSKDATIGNRIAYGRKSVRMETYDEWVERMAGGKNILEEARAKLAKEKE